MRSERRSTDTVHKAVRKLSHICGRKVGKCTEITKEK